MKTYPLSESQLGIFYEWQRNPSLMDYNLPCLYRYSRKIHPDRLEKALQEVFTARPIFYTRIVQQGAAILQYQDLERPIHIQRACLAEAELDETALRAAISATGYDVGEIRKEPWEKKGLFGR